MKKNFQILFLVLLTISTLVYLFWRFAFTIPLDHTALDIVCALIVLLVEMVGIVEMGIHFYSQYRANEYDAELPEWEDGDFPEVDVFVPTAGEPVEVLRRTLGGCLSMKYDDPKKIHIWLCDDKDRKEMRELAKELGVGYLQRESHEDAKAGNLNSALKKTNAPLVAIFDADMCPKEEFLLRTVPYFLGKNVVKGKRTLNQKMGYVQTPQVFGNADLFQRAFGAENIIPNEQDYFYRNLEIHRNRNNSVIFGGSNTVLSRAALKSTGGLVTGTLTEDFATGIEIQKRGYKTFAIREELAVGMTPDNLRSLIRQRSRWARGCIQSGRKTAYFFSENLTFLQKAGCFIAVSYWYVPFKKLVYLMAPILYAVFGITVMRCDFVQMLEFWLPMYVFSILGIRLFSDGTRTAKWSMIYETCLFPFLLMPVLKESIGIHEKTFQVTDKSGSNSEKKDAGWSVWYLVPFLVLIVLSVIGIRNIVIITLEKQSAHYLFLIFWLCFNLYYLLIAFVFVWNCRSLPEENGNNDFVHDLHKDNVFRTNLFIICIRSFKRKFTKKGSRV